MKKSKKIPKKSSPVNLVTPKQEIPPEQIVNKPKNKAMLFWVLGGVFIAIMLVFAGWFLGHKTSIQNNVGYNPYDVLKSYDPEAQPVTKDSFEKLFPNGDEIFDWLLKNNYFDETKGVSVHPRFITHEEKFNLKNKYPSEYRLIKALLDKANDPRHAFIIKSAEVSNDMVDRAVEALKERNLMEAIKDCNTAIDIFPLSAKPYILLTKLYLMTQQEEKLYDTLTLAGRSYPNFDNIVSIVDDADLDQIPLEEPSGNIYLANFPENKKMAISFLFDDGENDVYQNALPIFEKYGFRATIPIIAGMVSEKSDGSFFGTWDEWKDAANRGFEIANHSMFHRDSQKLHGSDFDLAIDQSKELIEKKIGHKVTAYIFPHDSYDDESVARALKNHEVVRTMEFLHSFYSKSAGIVYGGPNFSIETANRLVDIGIKRHLWIVANCHGVTTKHGIFSFKSITPDFLEKHLSYIHAQSKDVWVNTFTKIFEYMSLRAQTKIETKSLTDSSIIFNLHNNLSEKLTVPLTVIFKVNAGINIKSASEADGGPVKAWSCASDKVCVDVNSFDQDINVQWGSDK